MAGLAGSDFLEYNEEEPACVVFGQDDTPLIGNGYHVPQEGGLDESRFLDAIAE